MFDVYLAHAIACELCNGSARVGRKKCACAGGEVLSQGVRRLCVSEDGRFVVLPDTLSPGKERCEECDGWGNTHAGTVQDDSNDPEQICGRCGGHGED